MKDIKVYKTSELTLDINNNYNPLELDLDEWERFLTLLCGQRYYQKEAIRQAIVYLASKQYNNIEDLVLDNWNNKDKKELKERYKTLDMYLDRIQIKEKLFANIDLATGTGKSYVMYGISQIMLSIGLVDRVLVLCPSLTIEAGLTEKFNKLSSDSKLKNSIPDNLHFKNPKIINGNTTIKSGDICIENIHAIYSNNNSSIYDSLKNKGEKVLVLNDESHHIFNKVDGKDRESQNIKKWKEFILNKDYKFKYVLGFTGTAYIGDEYFNDVIYRYSLRKAVDDGIVKMIDYVRADDSKNDNEKFQKIYDNHIEMKNNYPLVKPISILITKDIKSAKGLETKLREFLMSSKGFIEDDLNKILITVTSDKAHIENVKRLKHVDDIEDSIEWIISVSMLTEGWDVKNIFQIVPWTDRAFNSKLLIAQVLGRGLRLPEKYSSPQPRVRVFNHTSFSKNIRTLVDEILEVEMKIHSRLVKNEEKGKYRFDIYNIDYDKITVEKESLIRQSEFDYTKGYVELVSQIDKDKKETEYQDLKGQTFIKSTSINYDTYHVDDIVNKIYTDLKNRQWEGKILKLPSGSYDKSNLPEKDELKKIIINSMKRRGIKGEQLIEENRQKLLTMFSTLLRNKGKTLINEKKVNSLEKIDLSLFKPEIISVSTLRKNATIYYSNNYYSEVIGDDKDILEGILDDSNFTMDDAKMINSYLFKTPFDLVFAHSEPERAFIKKLVEKDNAKHIDSWIKSKNRGLYSIEYSITSKGGRHSTIKEFNPDFFVKIVREDIDHIIVVEIKEDGDVRDKNKSKNKYAKKHFMALNEELKNAGINQLYHFHFLSPSSYSEFFEYIRNGQVLEGKFRSNLEDLLEGDE